MLLHLWPNVITLVTFITFVTSYYICAFNRRQLRQWECFVIFAISSHLCELEVEICQFVFGLCPLGVYPWGDRSGALQALHPHHFRFFLYVEVLYYFGEQVCCRRLLLLGFCWFHQHSVLSCQRALQPPACCSPLRYLHTPHHPWVPVGKRQFVLILSSHSSLIWTWQGSLWTAWRTIARVARIFLCHVILWPPTTLERWYWFC